jgi:DNA-binding CsgD family transcriptional regulator/tetratricopeptide (TPR) repeat protein
MPGNTRQESLVRLLEESSTPLAVADLADHLGVTVRTVLRDVTALRKLGHEIAGARGRGGGLSLPRRAETVPELRLVNASAESEPERSVQRRQPIFVGREAELDSLLDAFAEVKTGQGRVVMLAGEPGIGKTGVVQQLSNRLIDDGAQLYWGRCYESEGALPYWPWMQIISAYASANPPDLLRKEMGDGASDIAEMVPELHSVLTGLERSSVSYTPEAARFRLFRHVAGFLSRAADKAPMVLILEDLHWGDRPSLLLLEFLAQEIADSPVLLIGTYRDVELNRRHPLGQTLAGLNRQQHFLRMTLRGLDVEEVGRIVALASGQERSPELVASLHEQTEGNPLFVTEMVKLLLEEGSLSDDDHIHILGRVPEGVREAIGRRLDRLSDAANTVLRSVSVMGREFSIPEARRLSAGLSEYQNIPGNDAGNDFGNVLEAGDETEILLVLEEALQAGIIERKAQELASYQFTHSLIRDTLYEELTTPERVRLHRLAGETIETIHGSSLDAHLSQLAHHFLEASQGGNPEKAVHYAERAGDRAGEMVAYEEASRLYGMALQALQLAEHPDDARRCELMIALGRSQMMAGELVEARETLASTAAIARRINATELESEAAIAFEIVGWLPEYDGSPAVELLSNVLERIPTKDSEIRARVLASLGRAFTYSGQIESALTVGRGAIAMARRIGDPETLAITIWSRLPARFDPSDIHERVALAMEAIGISEELGRDEMVTEAQSWLINDFLELGDIESWDLLFDPWRINTEKSRVAMWLFNLRNIEIGTEFRHGRFEEVERLTAALLELETDVRGLDAAGVHGGTMFALRREQGRLEEVRPALQLFIKLNPAGVWRPGLALLYAELDMRDEARGEFEGLAEDEFSAIKRDGLYTTTIVHVADVCSYLGDRERAAVLYRMLEPYEGLNITLGIGHVYQGPISRYMGTLATTMERWADAERHFTDALDMARRMSSPPQEAHIQLAYAQMLSQKSGPARLHPDDRARIRHLLGDASATATELGMQAVVRRADQALQALGPESPQKASYPAGLSAREVDVLRLLVDGRSNQEIGGELFITANTVANHIKNILGKTGASNRTEAAAFAVRNDLG